MKEITLANGRGVAMVDDEDFERLSQYRWYLHSGRYARTTLSVDGTKRKKYMHQMILKAPNGIELDHINRFGLDNRKENLRLASRSQQRMNTIPAKTSQSGYRGVYLKQDRNRTRPWVARVRVDRRSHYSHYFSTAEEAARAYDKIARILHGEFAILNFPLEGERAA